jgi:hypothetical protein
VNLVSVIIAPIVVKYADPTLPNAVKIGVLVVAVVLLGVLAWAVIRSKAPAPEMGAATVPAPVSVAATPKAVVNKPKNKKR